jgi:A/G-specific adenine glycosylase
VLKRWQGLGYYTRARNMLTTARVIVNEMSGEFPDTFERLITMKGIGEYTAAAIASLAFNEPVAVVDGNVYRLISRLFGVTIPIDSNEGRSWFSKKAAELLDRKNPGLHNQAMMEFGALVCLPQHPLCSGCVLAEICQARLKDMVGLLPVKKPKSKARIRYFNYLVTDYHGKTILKKRKDRDIWHSLYEFPMVESKSPAEFEQLINESAWKPFSDHIVGIQENEVVYHHKLTHQTLVCSFTKVNLSREPQMDEEYILTDIGDLNVYAVPRVIERYLQDVKADP